MSKDELKIVTIKMEQAHWDEITEFAKEYGIDSSSLMRFVTLQYIRDRRNKEHSDK